MQLRAKIVSETPAGARESLRGFIETDLRKKTNDNVVHEIYAGTSPVCVRRSNSLLKNRYDPRTHTKKTLSSSYFVDRPLAFADAHHFSEALSPRSVPCAYNARVTSTMRLASVSTLSSSVSPVTNSQRVSFWGIESSATS